MAMVETVLKKAPLCGSACLILLLVSLVVSLSPNVVAARTWHVPGDVATIQAAIAGAQAGDDVLVSPGEYAEGNIALKGDVPVRSENGRDVTTINASGIGNGLLCSNQGQVSVEGFTILNGHAVNGGGFSAIGVTHLLIQGCRITSCSASGSGGALYAQDSYLQAVDCEFLQDNSTVNGGAIYSTGGEILAQDCQVSHCSAGIGGGLSTHGTIVSLFRCEVTDNSSSTAGGIRADGGTLTLADCSISRNTASGMGGGVQAGWLSASFERCVVASNHALAGSGVDCGNSQFTFVFEDCLFVHNNSDQLRLAGSGRITGCTIAAGATEGDWIIDVYDPSLESLAIERTIIAFNGQMLCNCPMPGLSIRCCDIYGNWSDTVCAEDLGGNISQDPIFCDMQGDDYSLNGSSPCLPGNIHGGVDCGLIGAFGQGCGASVGGACCMGDGTCRYILQSECTALGGVFQGTQVRCDAVQCPPPPTGACCMDDQGRCLFLTHGQCDEAHGSYKGDGMTCEPENPCPIVPTRMTTWGRIKAGFRGAGK
jgi:predicted outer membrane repeat protein